MKHLLPLFLAVCSATAMAEISDKQLPELRGLYVHNSHLVSSGMPQQADYAQLKTAGVDTVINVIATDSKWDKENGFSPVAADARDAGLVHYNVPFEPTEPVATMEHFIAVMDRLEQTDKDVLVHCAWNWRASGMVYLYHGIKTGKLNRAELAPWGDLEKAFAGSPSLKNFFDVVEAHYGLEPVLPAN